MRPTSIIFDLDGTLVDTADDVGDMINPLLDAAGRRGLSRADVIACFGLGAARFVDRALALTGGPLGPVEQETLMAAFLDRYTTARPVRSHAYPGAGEMLAGFAAKRIALGVCTNKPGAAARLLLDHLGLSHRFAAIVGGDDAGFRKPHPAHLLHTIAACGGEPASSVMVGDSETDAAAAAACNVPCILVAGGYTHGDGPATVACTVPDLAGVAAAIAALPAGESATDAPGYSSSKRGS